MPTVFTKDGFRFFFYSNDHTSIHVLARKGNGESVGLKTKKLSKAEGLAESHQTLIIEKWHEYFD